MSFKNQIRIAIQKGLGATGDLQEPSVYTSVASSSYNTTTGAITKVSTAYADVPVIYDSYKRREIDGEAIRPEDMKAIIARENLTVVPSLNDLLTREDGSVWCVMHVETDPAQAAYILQLRRP